MREESYRSVVFRRGFTLVELLVVVGIMGLLGSLAAGAYWAMVRGMEERGVLTNVNSFVRAAYQRAQIDRQPTIVYFWNETLRSKTDKDFEIVVGKAVAIRRTGRISRVDGSVLVDEFADLDATFMSADDGSGGSTGSQLDLYPMDNLTQGGLLRSLVEAHVVACDDDVRYLGGLTGSDMIPGYGFRLKGGFSGWKQGMAYGFEFLRLQLPDGYIFGQSHSSNADNPVTDVDKLVFDVGRNDNTGRNTGGISGNGTIEISALRQNGAVLAPVKIGTSESPDRRM